MPDWAGRMFQLGLYLAEGWCIRYLFSAFLTPRAKDLPGSASAVSVLWAACQMLCHINGPDYFPSSVTGLLLYILLLLGFCLLWYRDGPALKCFAVLQFAAIHELCIWGGNSLLWPAGRLCELLAAAMERQALSPQALMAAVRAVSVCAVLLTGVLREGMTFFFVRRIVASCREPFARDAAFYLLPAAAGVLTAAMIRAALLSAENGYAVTLYEKYPLLYLIVPLLALTLLAADVFSFTTYQEMAGRQRERAERAVLENQVAQLQGSVAELERQYQGVRAVRHDMKNHLMVLQRLMSEDGAPAGARQYFDGLYRTVERLDRPVCTGDPVSDAVLSAKFQYARQAVGGVRLDADGFVLPAGAGVHPCDMGVILSNGLDNAIEACRRLKQKDPAADAWIAVRSVQKGKMLLIEMENSFDGEIRFDAARYPVSGKADREAHGIGLRNIRSCAEKYGGGMDCTVREHRFILSVMLKTAARPDDQTAGEAHDLCKPAPRQEAALL